MIAIDIGGAQYTTDEINEPPCTSFGVDEPGAGAAYASTVGLWLGAAALSTRSQAAAKKWTHGRNRSLARVRLAKGKLYPGLLTSAPATRRQPSSGRSWKMQSLIAFASTPRITAGRGGRGAP